MLTNSTVGHKFSGFTSKPTTSNQFFFVFWSFPVSFSPSLSKWIVQRGGDTRCLGASFLGTSGVNGPRKGTTNLPPAYLVSWVLRLPGGWSFVAHCLLPWLIVEFFCLFVVWSASLYRMCQLSVLIAPRRNVSWCAPLVLAANVCLRVVWTTLRVWLLLSFQLGLPFCIFWACPLEKGPNC